MRRAHLLLATPLLMLVAAVPARAGEPPATSTATAPTTSPESPLSTRLENQQLLRNEFDSAPVLPSARVAQVIQIALDGGNVHVTTPLPVGPGSSIDVTDWPGRTLVVVGANDSLLFHLKHMRLFDTGLTLENTEVYTGPDRLQIVRETEGQAGLHSVTLIQSRQSADPDGNPVRVLISDTPDGGETARKTLSAESFEKLRQANGPQLRKELLPILKDLGAASLLQSVTAETAWQVLGGDITADAATNQRLDELLRDLSADDFAIRAKAEDALAAIGPAATAALGHRDLSQLADDPRAAVDNVLHRAQKLSAADVIKLSRDPDFLLDTAGGDLDSRLQTAAIVRLRTVTGKPLDLPADLTPSERQKRLDAFRESLHPTTQPSR